MLFITVGAKYSRRDFIFFFFFLHLNSSANSVMYIFKTYPCQTPSVTSTPRTWGQVIRCLIWTNLMTCFLGSLLLCQPLPQLFPPCSRQNDLWTWALDHMTPVFKTLRWLLFSHRTKSKALVKLCTDPSPFTPSSLQKQDSFCSWNSPGLFLLPSLYTCCVDIP